MTSLRGVIEMVALVVAPITLVTALLYYFGTIRARATYGYFGVDLSVLGLSNQDFISRSAGVAFRPIAVLLLMTAAATALVGLTRRLERGPRRRLTIVTWLVAVAAVLMLCCGVAGLFNYLIAGSAMLAAFALGSGAVASEVAVSLAGALRGGASMSTARSVAVRRATVVGAVLVACFWATAAYAQEGGTILAKAIAGDLGRQPGAVVYSERQLQISGPGLQADPLGGENPLYRYRYSGLRLLIHGDDR